MGRRKETLPESLFGVLRVMPIWVGPLLAVAVFLITAWVVPALLEKPKVEFSAESPEKAVSFGRDILFGGVARASRLAAPWLTGFILLIWGCAVVANLVQPAGRKPARSKVEETPATTISDSPQCPACGSPMKKQTARRGRNAGNQFWGCTHYPKCRGTHEI